MYSKFRVCLIYGRVLTCLMWDKFCKLNEHACVDRGCPCWVKIIKNKQTLYGILTLELRKISLKYGIIVLWGKKIITLLLFIFCKKKLKKKLFYETFMKLWFSFSFIIYAIFIASLRIRPKSFGFHFAWLKNNSILISCNFSDQWT